MKAISAVLAAVAMMGVAGTAQAIDLRNEDATPHTVKITSSTMTRDVDMQALTLSFVVCVGECTFEVEGIGTVTASEADVVTIKDGKVTTAAKNPAR